LVEPHRHGDERVGVLAAGLDQQDLDVGVGGEAVGEHTPRRSGTHDDVVERCHRDSFVVLPRGRDHDAGDEPSGY
jgi:hypothetical protein